ncbi:MAG: hypothetical protein RH948_02885 [Cyclobacteriaceae bacterium]
MISQHTLTATEAHNIIINATRSTISISKETITEDIHIQRKIKSQVISHSTFHNIKITDNEVDILEFENCYINELLISNCKLQSIIFSELRAERIVFDNCEVSNIRITGDIENEIITRDSHIDHLIIKSTFTRSLEVSCTETKKINRISINSDKSIASAKFSGPIKSITLSRIRGSFEFMNATVDTLNIGKNTRPLQIIIRHSRILNSTLNECTVGSMKIGNSNIKMRIAGGTYTSITFEDEGEIILNSYLSKRISVGSIYFQLFTVNSNSKIHFNNIDIGKLHLEYFDNYGILQFNECMVNESMTLYHATLRSTNFNNFSFSKKCNVEILDSHLIESSFTNTTWPRANKLLEHSEKSYNKERFRDYLKYLKSLFESYRQLKWIYTSHGSKNEGLEFLKNEQRIYCKILNTNKYNSWNDFADYLILKTNQCFSEFGQNIWRPIFYGILIHSILYYCILGYNPTLGIKLGIPYDPQATKYGFSLFFDLLLPTHSSQVYAFNSNEEVRLNGILNLLIRVSSSYFIFYFIMATRKFHQK